MEHILKSIRHRRFEQDAQWGGPQHDDAHSFVDWEIITSNFVYRAFNSLNQPIDVRYKALLDIAALCVAQMESLERLHDLPTRPKTPDVGTLVPYVHPDFKSMSTPEFADWLSERFDTSVKINERECPVLGPVADVFASSDLDSDEQQCDHIETITTVYDDPDACWKYTVFMHWTFRYMAPVFLSDDSPDIRNALLENPFFGIGMIDAYRNIGLQNGLQVMMNPKGNLYLVPIEGWQPKDYKAIALSALTPAESTPDN